MSKHKTLQDMTRHVLNIFNEHEIPYWLSCGTLLGAIREKDIIEWDDDADICIMQEHSHLVAQVIPKIVKKGLINNVCATWDGGFKIKHHPLLSKNAPWIDVYPYVRNGDMVGHVQKCFAVPDNKAAWTDERLWVDFLGTKACIPVEYDKLLTLWYKDYMTPKKTNSYWGA